MEELRAFQKRVHLNSKNKGFWEDAKGIHESLLVLGSEEEDEDGLFEAFYQMVIGQKIALIHSEVSEALEGIRHDNPPDDKIPEFSNAEAELADAIIRILDLAEYMDWDVVGALEAKADFNETRPYKHGKKS